MPKLLLRPALLLTLLPLLLPGQTPLPSALDLGQAYERAIVVCRLVGKGTYDDPQRPALVPARLKRDAKEKEGAKGTDVVLGYAWTPSDDGKFAIVEVVVRDAEALAEFKRESAKVAEVTLFERGKHSADALDTELRKVKKDFDRRSLRAVAP